MSTHGGNRSPAPSPTIIGQCRRWRRDGYRPGLVGRSRGRRAVGLVRVREGRDGVVVLEMDDAARYNALTTAMVTDLKDALAIVRHDRTVRAVVLSGAG